MALKLLTVAEMKAHSPLAEVQALSEAALAQLEAEGLDLLEAELGRRLTLDSEDRAVVVEPTGLRVLALPERLAAVTSVVSESLGDITDMVETAADGWLLRGRYPWEYVFRSRVTVTGRWGTECPERAKRVLMDLVEALAVRRGDLVSRRDELSPWGTISDGGLRADRDPTHRAATLENLLRYDLRKRLAGLYRPDCVAVV